MSLVLPRPPSADRVESDPKGWARDMVAAVSAIAAEIERRSRIIDTPAKAVFSVSNIADATTTLDGATATLTDVIDFIGGLYDALNKRGILRSKAGDP